MAEIIPGASDFNQIPPSLRDAPEGRKMRMRIKKERQEQQEKLKEEDTAVIQAAVGQAAVPPNKE